jgi:hypothetical protein
MLSTTKFNQKDGFILGVNRNFEKGVGQRGLGEATATSSEDCKHIFKVLINILGLFPSNTCSHVLVDVCFNI